MLSATEKQCRACKRDLPTDAFSKDRSRPGGLSHWCRDCQSAKDRKRRAEHPERGRAYYERNRERIHRRAAEYKKQRPERERAVSLLNSAVRWGKIVRPDQCSKCEKVGAVEGHHADYSKPLEVEWLCRRCHRATHYFRAQEAE